MTVPVARLIYERIANFGDALNPWIWDALGDVDTTPGPMHPPLEESGLFICSIGSFLSAEFLGHFRVDRQLIVAGSGAGYGQFTNAFTLGRSFPRSSRPKPGNGSFAVDSPNVQIVWVRGPLTARRMNLDPRCAVADAAYLMRMLLTHEQLTRPKTLAPAFMPHVASVTLVPWKPACEQLGWTYIDPRSDRETVLEAIGAASFLVTEALHGAIAADALRTPWVATRSNGEILDFKWQDHCAAIGVAYRPVTVQPPWIPAAIEATQRHPLKRAAFNVRARLDNIGRSIETLCRQLAAAASGEAMLSSDAVIARVDEQLAERVQMVKKLVAAQRVEARNR